MKIELIVIGKTSENYLVQGIEEYLKRLKKYCVFNINVIPYLKTAKSLSENEIKEREGKNIIEITHPSDYIILLDENGKMYNSVDFAKSIEKMQLFSAKKIVFIIGGAYGFSKDIYERANLKISLSSMTFSHQMVRLIFVEQLYRAFSILNNEPYHHQ